MFALFRRGSVGSPPVLHRRLFLRRRYRAAGNEGRSTTEMNKPNVAFETEGKTGFEGALLATVNWTSGVGGSLVGETTSVVGESSTAVTMEANCQNEDITLKLR